MAFAASTHWEVHSGGADGNSGNGGGFDPGNANMATDLTTDTNTGNTTAPVVSSASYNFAARDVGHWVFIKSGTNWNPGWFQISSVASNKATVNATAGAWIDFNTLRPGAVNGIATVGTPTSGTWSVDYSQTDSAAVAYTDIVIGNPTTTTITSAGNPFGKNFIGNIIAVASGTGFTVQRIQIVSTSGTTATIDKTAGTAGSTGGTGNLGGAMATPGQVCALAVSNGNVLWLKSGTYTMSSSNNVAGGRITPPGGADTGAWRMFGFASLRGDRSTKPILQPSASTMNIITASNNAQHYENLEFRPNAQTNINAISMSGFEQNVRLCKFNGALTAFNGSTDGFIILDCEFASTGTIITGNVRYEMRRCVGTSCTGTVNMAARLCQVEECVFANFSGVSAITSSSYAGVVKNCTIYNCLDGITAAGGGAHLWVENCVAVNAPATRYGFKGNSSNKAGLRLVNCAGYNNAAGDTDGNWTTEGFITLTADPFTNAAGNDFSLNSTSGGGAALKAAGYPSSFTGVSTNNYLDVGAAQAQASAGSSGGGLKLAGGGGLAG